MEIKTFSKVDEKIYYEKLDNGLEVYLYPTNKTKNFYITISVKYGANVTKYKNEKETIEVIPGSAHFLEHKVMALSENEEISKRINDLGSLANAWTSYYGTNYNIFGSINLRENLKLLLDIFYNTNINEKNVEEEKGIIGEEIDMYKDQLDGLLSQKLFNNLFHESYVKNTVLGERSDIEKITAKHLNQIYKDFYATNNTFIVVCGDFDENEVLEDIKEYMKKVKTKKTPVPKRIKKKDLPTVGVLYEEFNKKVSNPRVKYAIKIDKSLFGIKDDTILKYYIGLILSTNLSVTSELFERYKNNGIVISMSYGVNVIDDYVIISVSALCKDEQKFIENIEKDIKTLVIEKAEFERKKKSVLKSVIVDFDSIEEIEYNITTSLMMDGEIDFDIYNSVNNMEYDMCQNVIDTIINNINANNISIIKTIK